VAALVSLLLPRQGGLPIARSLVAGMMGLAAEFDLPIAGGDTNSWDGPVVISVTAIGQTTEHGFWRRSGARAGDQIVVTGRFGGSILGRQFEFVPRVREALTLAANYRIHAATDVSDGLTLDLSHLFQASRCGAELRLDWIPVSEDARRLADSEPERKLRIAGSRIPKDSGGRDQDATFANAPNSREFGYVQRSWSALEHALSDGEDFELILAVPPDEAARLLADQPLDVPLTCIGQFIDRPGLWQVDPSSGHRPLDPRGYQH
jgi:thiamine-monophosphate kinase